MRDVETGRAAVEAVAGLDAGRLDLGALPTLAIDPLAPLVGEFRRAHPRVDDRAGGPTPTPPSLEELVATAGCEVALTVTAPSEADLVTVRLGAQDLLAVLPPGSNASHTMSITTLGRFPLVAAPPGTATRMQLEEAFADAGVTPMIAVVAEQREAILPLVLAGAGATLYPRPLAEQAARLGATVVALRPRLSRPVLLVHRRGPLSPAATAFVALARTSS